MTRKQLAAALALVLGAATLVLAAIAMVREFPRGAFAVACVTLALAAGWYGIRRRGVARTAAIAASALLLAVAVVLLIGRSPLLTVSIVAGCVLTLAAARSAFRVHVDLPEAPRPRRPVLFYNPRSGGGKAAAFDLPEQARKRGIEPIELTPGTDLEVLVREAVADGADGLAMAGGDGSQAIVAAIAAEHGLPYACVPAGTRNHFALDLGVDRDDVVGALDAFVDGGERVVDLADVNGRVFVNNVSLGLYAEAVQRHGYRDAKLRTIMDTVPDALGPGGSGLDLQLDRPGRQRAPVRRSDPRVEQPVPARPGGRIGNETAHRRRPARHHRRRRTTRRRRERRPDAPPLARVDGSEFDVRSDTPIAAGIDGEAVTLEAPLHFHTRPAALRVRIAHDHPGASPSALEPEGLWDSVRILGRLAAGHDPRPLPPGGRALRVERD